MTAIDYTPGERAMERCPACERRGIRARAQCRTCQGDGFLWMGELVALADARLERTRAARIKATVYPKGVTLYRKWQA